MSNARVEVEITAPVSSEYAEILSPAATAFLADLQQTFGARRKELLAARVARQTAERCGIARAPERRGTFGALARDRRAVDRIGWKRIDCAAGRAGADLARDVCPSQERRRSHSERRVHRQPRRVAE